MSERANSLFEQYVYHSYLYYQLNDPEWADWAFDKLCRELADAFDEVTHPDKHLTDIPALKAGTGFQMMFKWPQWCIDKAKESGHG